jgi:hypothetical protein
VKPWLCALAAPVRRPDSQRDGWLLSIPPARCLACPTLLQICFPCYFLMLLFSLRSVKPGKSHQERTAGVSVWRQRAQRAA